MQGPVLEQYIESLFEVWFNSGEYLSPSDPFVYGRASNANARRLADDKEQKEEENIEPRLTVYRRAVNRAEQSWLKSVLRAL